jgi:hypothetical protein
VGSIPTSGTSRVNAIASSGSARSGRTSLGLCGVAGSSAHNSRLYSVNNFAHARSASPVFAAERLSGTVNPWSAFG